MIFILMNMFLSIFNDSFTAVKDLGELKGFDQQLHDHLWETFAKLFKPCYGQAMHNKFLGSEMQLRMNLEGKGEPQIIRKKGRYLVWIKLQCKRCNNLSLSVA